MNEPEIGVRVLVRPSDPNHPVQRRAETFGQFMTNDWCEYVWDDWAHRRFGDGSIQWMPLPVEIPDETAAKKKGR